MRKSGYHGTGLKLGLLCVLLFAEGCATSEDASETVSIGIARSFDILSGNTESVSFDEEITTTDREVRGGRHLEMTEEPCGFTGCLIVTGSKLMETIEIAQQIRVQEEIDSGRVGDTMLKAIGSLGMQVLADPKGMAKGFNARKETSRTPYGPARHTVIDRRTAPLAHHKVTVSVPEANLSGRLSTNREGKIEFHLLEPVLETGGTSSLTITIQVDEAPQRSYKLAQSKALTLLTTYRDQLSSQVDTLYGQVKKRKLFMGSIRRELSAIEATDDSLKAEVMALQKKNDVLLRHREKLYRKSKFRKHVDLDKQQVAVWLNTGRVAATAVQSGKLAYDNYRLVKSGLSISSAFRLTLPSFIAGLFIERIMVSLADWFAMSDGNRPTLRSRSFPTSARTPRSRHLAARSVLFAYSGGEVVGGSPLP